MWREVKDDWENRQAPSPQNPLTGISDRKESGPEVSLSEGIEMTDAWYEEERDWVKKVDLGEV